MKAGNYNGSAVDLNRFDLNNLPVRKFTPRAQRRETNKSEHSVQFYEKDNFLLNSLCEYVVTGLKANEAVIVVATKSHRQKLARLLRKTGINVAEITASGQYIALDADELLAKFMVDGAPKRRLFTKAVGDVIERAANGRRGMRIFGEMVAILLAGGNRKATLRLEQFWNDLQKTLSFSLFCAYPINSFDGEKLASLLGNVCAAHSGVMPAESYAKIADTDERTRAIIQLQQKARSLQSEIEERTKAEETARELLRQIQLAEQELTELLAREHAARTRAEEACRLKDEFLATVSHELRTPLNAIIGWSHVLNNGRHDEKTVARAASTIQQNARAQAQLVEDMLDVSRVITGKLCLNMETVDAAAVIGAAIDSVRAAADSKNIEIAVTLNSSAHYITGDASRLQQIVWNLLSNAVKFTPAGGRVEVKVERDDGDLRISVSDTGKGIHPDFLPFIFDRFRQSDGSTTRGHGGLGLGLAIVRHLVELHGGTVNVESPGEGGGANFIIKLPLAIGLEKR